MADVTDFPTVRIDIGGAPAIAGHPERVTDPSARTPGTELATPAQIDAGLARYNPAANAWEIGVTESEGNGTSEDAGSGSGSGNGTGTGNGTGDGTATLPEVVVVGSKITKQQTYDNPLFDYESYTYNLSWHILSADDYKLIMANPESTYIPKNCLVASGGKNHSEFVRNPAFKEDFYFEDLRMTTVIGVTNRSRSSNVVEISFTLIEPNGFTLINRLLDAAKSVNSPNYIKQPYLLVIEFKGYKNGEPRDELRNQVKHIPIMLTGLTSKVTTRGAEYKIEAAPYNHIAMSSLNVVTPATLSVNGTTVREIFGEGPESTETASNANSAIRDQTSRAEAYSILSSPNSGVNDRRAAQEVLRNISDPSIKRFQVKSLTDGINGWLQAVANNQSKPPPGKTMYPNVYKIKFHDDIGKATLVDQFNNINNVATTSNKVADVKAAANLPVGQIEFKSGEFVVGAGTNIMTLIDFVVRNSSYITSQLADPADVAGPISSYRLKNDNPDSMLHWYKVVPSIEIGPYNYALNNYSYNITYNVRPWKVNPKNPYAPLGRTSGYVKKYSYIFTGQNRDVISCDLDFDMMYFIQLTADARKNQSAETVPTGTDNKDSAIALTPTDAVQQPTVHFTAGNSTTSSMSAGPGTGNKVRAADTSRDINQSSRGDMINIKLRILGDPHFIKQDDLFYNQTVDETQVQFLPNRSLAMDDGELYVFVDFQSPVDYADNTGLAIPGVSFDGQNRYQYSAFRGIYKVISVDNEFRNGKFEQVLDLARIPISDDIRDLALDIETRTESLLSAGLGQLLPLPSSAFKGPSIITNRLSGGGLSLANPDQMVGAVFGQGQRIIGDAVGKIVGTLTKNVIDAGTNVVKSVVSGTSFSDAIGGATLGGGTVNFGSVNLGQLSISSTLGSVLPGPIGSFVSGLNLGSVDLGSINLGSFNIGSFNVGEFFGFKQGGLDDFGLTDMGFDLSDVWT